MTGTPQCDAPQTWGLPPAGRCRRGGNPGRPFFSAVLGLALVLAACSGSRTEGPSFETEQARVQSGMPQEAQLVNAAGPRRDGLRTEAFWEYTISGGPDTARKAFAPSVPPGYHRVREGDPEVAYVMYDGHDSFSLTFTFVPSGPRSTRVTVRLRSIPD